MAYQKMALPIGYWEKLKWENGINHASLIYLKTISVNLNIFSLKKFHLMAIKRGCLHLKRGLPPELLLILERGVVEKHRLQFLEEKT